MEEKFTPIRTSFTKPYSTERILKLKRILEQAHSKGRPRYFEIMVDGFKVVYRTNDLSEFDLFEEHVDEDTNEVVFILYSDNATSPRNTRHIFKLKEEEKENKKEQPKEIPQPTQIGLSGAEVDLKLKEAMEKFTLDARVKELEKDLQQKTKQLQKAEEYIDKLTEKNEQLQTQFSETEKKLNLLGAAERVLTNPHLSNNVASLAGVLSGVPGKDEKEEKKEEKKEQQGEATFSKKKKEEPLTEDQKRHLQIVQAMEKELEGEELHTLMKINDVLITDKKKIPEVAYLLELK